MKDINKTKKQLLTEIQKTKRELKLLKKSINTKLNQESTNPFLSSIVKLSDNAIFSKSIDGYILTWNKGAEKTYGYKTKEIVGKHVSIIVPSEKKQELEKILKKIKSGKSIRNLETTRLTRHKGQISIKVNITPIRNKDGQIISALVMQQNKTQHEKIEKKAQKSEQKYLDILKYAPIGIVHTNKKGKILSANMSFAKMLGYSSPEEILKLNVAKDIYYNKSIRKKVLEHFESNDGLSGQDLLLKKKNGKAIWVHINSHVIRDDSGRTLYYENFLSDITKQLNAQQILMEREQSYRSLIESSIDPIYVLKGRKLLLVNEAWTKLFGYSREEAYSDDFDIMNIVAPESEAMVLERLKKLEDTKPLSSRYEITAKTKLGKLVRLDVSRSEIIWNGERAVQGVYRNITEKKRQEELLIIAKETAEKSDRLKTEFLSQMSHEIRTPLNNILAYTSLLKDDLEGKLSKDLETAFPVIDNSSQRLIRTIDQILNLSKILSGNFESKLEAIDLHKDILEDIVIEFYQRARNKNLELVYQNKSKNTLILGDRYSVNQIFLNLVENALKFTDKGKIKIIISDYRNKIKVTVADTGVGISNEFQGTIFDPFQQEKANKYSHGAGLGLSLVKKYAEINSATVTLNSTKWKGSKFSLIFIPLKK